jgi:hypothetical protein
MGHMAKKDDRVRMTRTLPRRLVGEIRAAAAIDGCGFNDVFVKALTRYVDTHEERELIKKVAAKGDKK